MHHRVNLDRTLGRSLKGKTDARTEADNLRAEIRAGRFRRGESVAEFVTKPLTFEQIGPTFLERYSKAREKRSWHQDELLHARLAAYELVAGDPRSLLGNKALVRSPRTTLKAFCKSCDPKVAPRAHNHYRQYLRALFAWATRKGYLAVNPLENAEIPRLTLSKRSRRLQPGEERKLLAAAPARLYRLIVAALETGCRLGELLSLQWHDVHFGRRELRVRAENAKDAEDRVVPITTRLAAVLEMAQHDPDGNRLPPEAHVFGDAIGGRVRNVTRLWQTCVLKAHDVRPTREKRTHEGTDRRGHRRQGGRLTRECCDAVGRIDLHFHDLRREAGSRWMEGGMALHVI